MNGTGLTCVARVYGFAALGLVQAPLRAADLWSCTDLPTGTTLLSAQAVALGGTRVFVLDRDAAEAEAILAALPSSTITPLRWWRKVLLVLFFLQCGVPVSPCAVFLRPRQAVIQKTR